MKCEHCSNEGLAKKYIKSKKMQGSKMKRYFRYCKACGYNSYYNFPSYLNESQFELYIEQINQKGNNSV